MRQINQKWDKILELLFEYPNKVFTVREISKGTKIPSSSVHRYIEMLKKFGFISDENKANITPYFKFRKAFFVINKMYEVGLIDFLTKELNPAVIIIFGSVRKGEYDKDSDIDLFIECSVKKNLDLKKYEKILGHKIQLFIEVNINELQSNLFNNVINGIKLYGSFKVR